MTSIALPLPDLEPDTVSVVVIGSGTPAVAALQQILPAGWTVSDAVDGVPDIVVCPAGSSVGDALRQWPAAAVVAVAPSHDDGSAAIAALTWGADVCVRGSDVRLVTAYLQSVARRRLSARKAQR